MEERFWSGERAVLFCLLAIWWVGSEGEDDGVRAIWRVFFFFFAWVCAVERLLR